VVRVVAWTTGLGAAGLTATLSIVAAHAFKGHDGTAKASATRPARAVARVRVPAPQKVPAIPAAPAPLQPPPQPPAAAPPAEPAPQTSGGS
jgi:hypothetical protein